MGFRPRTILPLLALLICCLARQGFASTWLNYGQRYPDLSEEEASRAIRVRITRKSARFSSALIRSSNSYASFECSDCRYMTLRTSSKLDALVRDAFKIWNKKKRVRVLLAWSEADVPGQPRSLHYEGGSRTIPFYPDL